MRIRFWQLFIPSWLCPHWWRRMTGKSDYGHWLSRHWGNYHGIPEQECRICGLVRQVRGWQAWRYEVDDAERRLGFLRSTEPEKP
jgi:hypothetical protein